MKTSKKSKKFIGFRGTFQPPFFNPNPTSIRNQRVCIKNTTVSDEHQIQEIFTACNEKVSRFNYFLPKLKTYSTNKIKAFNGGYISNKVQEWENITSGKEILETVEGLTLDFEQELPSQNTKMISGQASQKVMEEINKLIAKDVIEHSKHEKREFCFTSVLSFKI